MKTTVFLTVSVIHTPKLESCCPHISKKSHCVCDSAGIMYWGDVGHARIETAYLNGTGRRTLLTESSARYYAFAYDAGNIYFTDWRYMYVCLFSPATNLIGEWHHMFVYFPPDNVICKLLSRLDSRWLASVCIIIQSQFIHTCIFWHHIRRYDSDFALFDTFMGR